METETTTEDDGYVPRNYQVALFKKCVESNSIIFLPTGSGKTFIAVMVIKYMSNSLMGDDHKISIVLVNTVALVYQHGKYLKDHTPLKIGLYTGDSGVDYWSHEKWQVEFINKQVLVMTSQILCNIVLGGILDLNRVNLLIFDECHHGVNNHSMRQVMINFQNLDSKPKVIGLTATLLNGNCQPSKVMDEVRNLEITYHGKVATVDGLDCVVGYSTNPCERIEIYSDNKITSEEQELIELIEKAKETIGVIVQHERNSEPKTKLKNMKIKGLEFQKLVNILDDFLKHFIDLGYYTAKLACISVNILIEQFKLSSSKQIEIDILSYVETIMHYVYEKILKKLKCASEKEQIVKYSSPKIIKLLEVLADYPKTSTEPFCGIIFVERKFTAQLLYHLLKSISTTDEKYNFIKPNFITGNTGNPKCPTRENLYIGKKNRQTIIDLENKSINLVISTQVLEEGVDIPKCSFVCKFDPPKDYRSYIQSKGRGRHKSSQYIIFSEVKDLKTCVSKINSYSELEMLLNRFLLGTSDQRIIPTKREIEEMYNEDEIPPYFVDGPNSAQINLNSSISLLARYCNSLPSDKFTDLSPEYYIEFIDDKFCVTVVMPVISNILEPIEGPIMSTKKLAKKATALKVCILLHQSGDLDDNLNPIKRKVKETDVQFLFKHLPLEKEKDAGTKKLRFHDMMITESTKGPIEPNCSCYLHIIDLTPMFSGEDKGISALRNMYAANLCYGFITPKPLPRLCSFPLFITNGTVMVNIKENSRTYNLSENEVRIIQEFNVCVYKDVLEVLKDFLLIDKSDNANSMLIVAVQKVTETIDFEIMKANCKIKDKHTNPSKEEKLQVLSKDFDCTDRIVIPYYRNNLSVYLVTEVLSDMSPNSSFPSDEHGTFKDYFFSKYGQRVSSDEQPLLLVKGLSRSLKVMKPAGIDKKRKKEIIHEEGEEKLIPELLIIQDFPASLWTQARFLPAILSRCYFMLGIEDLRQQIGKKCGFKLGDNSKPLEVNLNLLNYNPSIEKNPDTPIKINYKAMTHSEVELSSLNAKIDIDFQKKNLESQYPWNDIDEPKDIFRDLNVNAADIEFYNSFISQKILPTESVDPISPTKPPAITYELNYEEKFVELIEPQNDFVQISDIYESMTTSKSNDIVNLERYETLGDSFLKFITSFYIMNKFPLYDEGRATSLKGLLVSNKNLFYIACRHQIGGRVKNCDLDPRSEWLPPGFKLPDTVEQLITDKKVSLDQMFHVHLSRDEQINGEMKTELTIEQEEFEEDDKNYASTSKYFKKQCVKDKVIADAVEALLGVYLKKTGILGVLKLIHYLNIIPPEENLLEMFNTPPPSPIKNFSNVQQISCLLPQGKEIESILGYSFKDKSYLLQALTHSSYSMNRVTLSYERLEFLGDAILDFLITCHIFEKCDKLTPGDLTDLRSALVNNNTFASLIVKNQLHKYILLMNSKLQGYIDSFVEFMKLKNFEIDDQVLILLEEDDLSLGECMEVPKVLGDVFEALIGAVYLDSNYDLKRTWQVIHKIMWKEIEMFSRNVPKNAIRKIHEIADAYPLFSAPQKVFEGRVMVTLDFMAKGRYCKVSGFGSNKFSAKKAAAKVALRRFVDN